MVALVVILRRICKANLAKTFARYKGHLGPSGPKLEKECAGAQNQKGKRAINLGNLGKFMLGRSAASKKLLMLGRLVVPKHFKYWGNS